MPFLGTGDLKTLHVIVFRLCLVWRNGDRHIPMEYDNPLYLCIPNLSTREEGAYNRNIGGGVVVYR